MTERAAIRLGVPVLLLASAGGAVAVSLHTPTSTIPSIAFGSHVVLAVQVALLFFYAGLLLLVPLMRALSDGDLPIELSLKGARWTEDIEEFGDEVSDRQAEAEERRLTTDIAFEGKLEMLGEELEAMVKSQEDDADGFDARIAALEKQINSEN